MFNSSSHSDYSERTATAVNTNVLDTVTQSLYINGNRGIGLHIYADSGTHASHVVTVQVSANDTDWTDTTLSIMGVGSVEGETTAQYIRAKVTTAEGANSTVNIYLTSK